MNVESLIWKFYVGLVSRRTCQPILEGKGDDCEIIESIYITFRELRETIQQVGDDEVFLKLVSPLFLHLKAFLEQWDALRWEVLRQRGMHGVVNPSAQFRDALKDFQHECRGYAERIRSTYEFNQFLVWV